MAAEPLNRLDFYDPGSGQFGKRVPIPGSGVDRLFAARTVVAEWATGGSPDMAQVSADGSQVWTSGRFHGEVYVTDTRNGETVRRIRTGAAPHGLTIFPQPGRYSIGHNGVYR